MSTTAYAAPGTGDHDSAAGAAKSRPDRLPPLRPPPLLPLQELDRNAADTRYTKDHEWVRLDGDIATVGITAYAAEQLGDVVFVELPAVGRAVKKGEGAAVVESVKAASDVYSPISGEVTERNAALDDRPQTVNEAPQLDGWFARLKLGDKSDLDGLLDEEGYRAFVATL